MIFSVNSLQFFTFWSCLVLKVICLLSILQWSLGYSIHSSKRVLNPPLLSAPPFWFSTPFLKYHPSTPSSVNHPLFNKNPPNPPLFKPKFCIDQKLHETSAICQFTLLTDRLIQTLTGSLVVMVTGNTVTTQNISPVFHTYT